MDPVHHVLLCCHDSGCRSVYEAYGPLHDLERLVCDCGHALQIVRHLGEERGESRSVQIVRLAA
jgi:hypothetical protein